MSYIPSQNLNFDATAYTPSVNLELTTAGGSAGYVPNLSFTFDNAAHTPTTDFDLSSPVGGGSEVNIFYSLPEKTDINASGPVVGEVNITYSLSDNTTIFASDPVVGSVNISYSLTDNAAISAVGYAVGEVNITYPISDNTVIVASDPAVGIVNLSYSLTGSSEIVSFGPASESVDLSYFVFDSEPYTPTTEVVFVMDSIGEVDISYSFADNAFISAEGYSIGVVNIPYSITSNSEIVAFGPIGGSVDPSYFIFYAPPYTPSTEVNFDLQTLMIGEADLFYSLPEKTVINASGPVVGDAYLSYSLLDNSSITATVSQGGYALAIQPPSTDIDAFGGAFVSIQRFSSKVRASLVQRSEGAPVLFGPTKDVQAYGASQVRVSSMARQLQSTGTNTPVGRVNLNTVNFDLEAKGFVGQLASVHIDSPVFSLNAYSGGQTLLGSLSHSLFAQLGGQATLGGFNTTIAAHGIRGTKASVNLSAMATSITAIGGSQSAVLSFNSPQISAYGGGYVALGMANIKVESSGFSGTLGSVSLRKPNRTLKAQGGAVSGISISAHVEARGILGNVSRAYLGMFSTDISSTGTDIAYGRVTIQPPEVVSLYGISNISGPMKRVSVYSRLTITPSDLTSGYTMTISSSEMTRYTNFDFQYIVRFNGDYYGVKENGLYLLEGDSDQGVPIQGRFKTAMLDFGTASHKRVPYAYIDTEDGTSITTYVEGEMVNTFYATHGGRRTRLDRGSRGRQWEFEIKNTDGGAMKIGSLELYAQTLSRKV